MKSVLGFEVRELFDPIQTHAAYGVPVERVDLVKERLRELGAVRFRKVKNGLGNINLCFKLKKVDTRAK